MRRLITLMASVLFVVAILTSTGCATTSDSTFNWRFYATEDFNSVNSRVWAECFEELGTRTDGRLTVDVHWLGEHPYEGFDMLDVVRDGTCELGHTQSVDLTGIEPIMGGVSLLFLVPDELTGKRLSDRVNAELINPYLEEKYNLFILGSAIGGGQAIHATKELNSFEAMEGMRIRVFGKETADAITALGGIPSTFEGAEMYNVLQRGIVDGTLGPTNFAYDQKWYEVVKHVTLWNEFVYTDLILVNQDAIEELPDDLKTILQDTVDEYAMKVTEELLEKNVTARDKAAAEYGVTFYDIDPAFRDAVIDTVKVAVWPGWAERAGDLADPFFEIVEDELG